MESVTLKHLFQKKYIIPCFQREYSWDDVEINELLTDIKNSNKSYCVGIITTKTIEGKTVLIDGQQRLTTLYLIAIATGYINSIDNINLEYEFAKEFKKIEAEQRNADESLQYNDLKRLFENNMNVSFNLLNGWKIVNKFIKEDKNEIIKRNLDNLNFYLINLDDDINDMNHYFEVMNSRGVQLSRTDIVKSILINKLSSDDDKNRLNNLWYLLEDMKNIKKKCKNYKSISKKSSGKLVSIKSIIDSNKKKEENVIEGNILESDDNIILDFDYFLLYTIRLYNRINNEYNSDFIQDKMYDLKDLSSEYRKTFQYGKESDVKKFLDFLIRTKINYETYIVRYDKNDAQYKININSKFKDEILLIQTCLRVSFTNRKLMHWIFETLYFFNDTSNNEKDYVEYIIKLIEDDYISEYLYDEDNKKINYSTGVATPHIVMNYLDYLLLKNKETLLVDYPYLRDVKFDKFTFKVRNSIEHYMPRENDLGYKWVDDFGNLALLAYSTNTRIQNAMPDEKNGTFKSNISDYSLKLQIMYYITCNNRGNWNENLSKEFGKYCISLLMKKINNEI